MNVNAWAWISADQSVYFHHRNMNMCSKYMEKDFLGRQCQHLSSVVPNEERVDDVAARSLMENLAGFVTVVSFSVNQSYISLGGACHLLPW